MIGNLNDSYLEGEKTERKQAKAVTGKVAAPHSGQNRGL